MHKRHGRIKNALPVLVRIKRQYKAAALGKIAGYIKIYEGIRRVIISGIMKAQGRYKIRQQRQDKKQA